MSVEQAYHGLGVVAMAVLVVLCKVYTGIYRERRHEEERLRAEDSGKETDK